jgi:hypothetical protein
MPNLNRLKIIGKGKEKGEKKNEENKDHDSSHRFMHGSNNVCRMLNK